METATRHIKAVRVQELGETVASIDFTNPDDTRAFVSKNLNIIELLCQENENLRAENQRLKDEVNTLKGQKGRPKIQKNKDQDDRSDNTNFQSGIKPEKKKPKKKAKKKEHGKR